MKSNLLFFNDITDLGLTNSISIFGSCYSKNCFLSTHTDIGRGKLAFVFNVTKNWDNNDGGYFELLAPNWSTVIKRVEPVFNSLTMFLVEGNGIPHRVIPVSSTTENRRIAYSGWLI